MALPTTPTTPTMGRRMPSKIQVIISSCSSPRSHRESFSVLLCILKFEHFLITWQCRIFSQTDSRKKPILRPFLKTLVQSRQTRICQYVALQWKTQMESWKWKLLLLLFSPWYHATHPHQHLFFFVWLMGKSVLCGTWKKLQISPCSQKTDAEISVRNIFWEISLQCIVWLFWCFVFVWQSCNSLLKVRRPTGDGIYWVAS